eukprot:Amastigsp_a184708_4.p5 type:complete len:109 gc:universal Amastigsp_a184708_4:911-585(-)
MAPASKSTRRTTYPPNMHAARSCEASEGCHLSRHTPPPASSDASGLRSARTSHKHTRSSYEPETKCSGCALECRIEHTPAVCSVILATGRPDSARVSQTFSAASSPPE